MEILAYVFQAILILMFAMAGIGKVVGSEMHVEGFEHWRLPQWFRVLTGIVEIVGAALLLIGYWAPSYAMAGALVLGITGIGGIVTHIRAKDTFKETLTILILAILSFIVFFIYYL
ncbi:DoxX family protein [Rummeliibacillus sp. NPDC094406]|uniref:DoxX family protein n=1 Tax=Rummeliibacillus sp. NPDC094406 TaxID=3364511 RepID=UPI0037FB9FD3